MLVTVVNPRTGNTHRVHEAFVRSMYWLPALADLTSDDAAHVFNSSLDQVKDQVPQEPSAALAA